MPINYFIDIEQIVKTLCMMNNKFMNAMLHDNIPATQKMLRVIMKNDKIKVISAGRDYEELPETYVIFYYRK